MRFLFDAHHLGRRETGNETWVRNVIRAVDGLGTGEVHYAVGRAGLAELRRLTSAPAHILADNSLRRLLLDVPRIARQTRSDAIFATYTAPLTRRPVVLMVYDASPWHPDARQWLPPLTRVQYRASMGASARRVARVLAPSLAARADLAAAVGIPQARISVAPCAVDVDLDLLLRALPRRETEGPFRVLAVGNVVPRKNLVVLAGAVRACLQAGVPMELRIVGTVPKDGDLAVAAIRRLLGPHMRMTGYVTPEQLAAEYKAAAVLGFPSLFEGFGMPPLEAMAAGTPVVVSDASVLPETVGEAALIRPAGDVGAWRDALLRLHDDAALRDELRRRGWRRARAFSWQHTAATLLEQLRAAAGRNPAARAPVDRPR